MSNSFNNIINNLAIVSLKCNMRTAHVSAIIKGKKIITTGYNHRRGYFKGDICMGVHAEQHAINKYYKKQYLLCT